MYDIAGKECLGCGCIFLDWDDNWAYCDCHYVKRFHKFKQEIFYIQIEPLLKLPQKFSKRFNGVDLESLLC
jgi:hypothetical protein